jgi:hypothetical protein
MAPRFQAQPGNEGCVERCRYSHGNDTDHHGPDVEENDYSAQQRDSANEGNDPTLDGRLRRHRKLDEQPAPDEPEPG